MAFAKLVGGDGFVVGTIVLRRDDPFLGKTNDLPAQIRDGLRAMMRCSVSCLQGSPARTGPNSFL
jgi:hypothetical protein